MSYKELFNKASMLRPITSRIFPTQEEQARKKQAEVIAKQGELDALRLDREKRLFELRK